MLESEQRPEGSVIEMAMSRKDYEAIAKAIAEVRWEATTGAPGEGEVSLRDPEVVGKLIATRDVVVELVKVFANDNERFDRERFIKACQISDIENVTGNWTLILDR